MTHHICPMSQIHESYVTKHNVIHACGTVYGPSTDLQIMYTSKLENPTGSMPKTTSTALLRNISKDQEFFTADMSISEQ